MGCVIVGDNNIDLSKYSEHVCTTDYVDTLLASNFYRLLSCLHGLLLHPHQSLIIILL